MQPWASPARAARRRPASLVIAGRDVLPLHLRREIVEAFGALLFEALGYAGRVDSGAAARRVIFVDIDGVLAPIRRWDRYGDLDPGCVRVLNEIVARAGAEVVVSSTWRHGRSVAELQQMLAAHGFAGRVVDKTPVGAPGAGRADEIAAWLATHAVAGYVIIDDHVVDVDGLSSRLLLIHPAHGLQPADAARAVATLLRPARS